MFPEHAVVKRISQSLAMLEAIIMPEWEYRYYSYNSKWAHHLEMASMRDGAGSYYFILFSGEEIVIKGFNESTGINNGVAEYLKNLSQLDNALVKYYIQEPAFINDQISFFGFWDSTQRKWNGIIDQNETMFEIFTDPVSCYYDFCLEYYENSYDKKIIQEIIDFKPLNQRMIKQLNPKLSINLLQEDLDEIGYPMEG